MIQMNEQERAAMVLGLLKQIESEEGIFVSEETKEDARLYVDGTIDVRELMQRIQKRKKR